MTISANFSLTQRNEFKQFQMIDLSEHNLQISIFQLHEDGPAAEELEGDEELAAANHWLLPSKDFSGLWENLVFDRDIKAQVGFISYDLTPVLIKLGRGSDYLKIMMTFFYIDLIFRIGHNWALY